MKRFIRFIVSSLLIPPGLAAQVASQPQGEVATQVLQRSEAQQKAPETRKSSAPDTTPRISSTQQATPSPASATPPTVIDAPSTAKAKQEVHEYWPYIGAFAGAGVANNSQSYRRAQQAGGFVQLGFFQLEGAYVGGNAPSEDAGVLSANIWLPMRSTGRVVPFATGGYSYFGGLGSGGNAGVGIDVVLGNHDWTNVALRFEVRDYIRSADHLENRVAFRIGILKSGPITD